MSSDWPDVPQGDHDHAAQGDDARDHLRLPSVGSDGLLYLAFVGGFDTKNKPDRPRIRDTLLDDGVTFGPFVEAATPI